jgi:hypothetical protein
MRPWGHGAMVPWGRAAADRTHPVDIVVQVKFFLEGFSGGFAKSRRKQKWFEDHQELWFQNLELSLPIQGKMGRQRAGRAPITPHRGRRAGRTYADRERAPGGVR